MRTSGFFKRSELNNTVNGVLDPEPNKPPVLSQNQYGGAFGGPIKKDKLFFFVSYQETSQKKWAYVLWFPDRRFASDPGLDR